MSRRKGKSYASAWDAFSDTPEQAAHLRARAELMQQAAATVNESGWKQPNAAECRGVTQLRINDLPRGRVSLFSLDALFYIATTLGRCVYVAIERA
jgi:predicted XRE-type DNA-binding protein